MKNKFTLFCAFLILPLMTSCSEKYTLKIYHHAEEFSTIIPRTEKSVMAEGKSFSIHISESDFERILGCISGGEKINEMRLYKFQLPELEFHDYTKEDSISDSKPVTSEPQDFWSEEINDFHLNVNYVVLLKKNLKTTKIVFGSRRNIIRVNNEYFSIDSEKICELEKIVKKYIDVHLQTDNNGSE